MTKSREELQQQLRQLQNTLPALIEQYPEDKDFLEAFVREADVIADQATPDDYSWVNEQIIRILSGRGKLQDIHEPPTTSSSPPADPDDGDGPVAE